MFGKKKPQGNRIVQQQAQPTPSNHTDFQKEGSSAPVSGGKMAQPTEQIVGGTKPFKPENRSNE